MLPALHAERQLAAIEAASITEMKDADRGRVLRRYAQASAATPRRVSLHEALSELPIPVKRVRA